MYLDTSSWTLLAVGLLGCLAGYHSAKRGAGLLRALSFTAAIVICGVIFLHVTQMLGLLIPLAAFLLAAVVAWRLRPGHGRAAKRPEMPPQP